MTLQAGTLLIFGIDTPLKTYGLLQDYSIADKVQRAESLAPDGHVISIQEYNDTSVLNLTYLPVFEGTGDPVIGTIFTFDSTSWHIDEITDSYDVSGFEVKQVIAKYYPQIG